MNTPANTLPDSPLEPQAVAPAVISEAQRLYWSMRRELWGNRAIYLAPLAVAAVFIFAFLISSIAGIWEGPLRLDPAQSPAKLAVRLRCAAADGGNFHRFHLLLS